MLEIKTAQWLQSERPKWEGEHNMRNRIGGAILALAAILGIFAATTRTTQAQWRNDDGYYRRDRDDDDRRYRRNRERRNDRYGRNNSQVELNQGYQYGLNTGANDAQRRQGYSPQRSRYYRSAPSQAFRHGFVRGYDQGYRQYANSGNGRYGNGRYGRNDGYGNGGYNNNAELNRGYQQGVETGSSDGQRGQSYNPQRSRHYQNASTQAFREGFVRGYDQGYRQYANGGYRNSNGGGIADILGGILGRP